MRMGGSHRKIILDAVPDAPTLLGYFDEPTPEETQDTATTAIVFSQATQTVTGGMYRNHGAAHATKLNPVIKMMLRDIFLKAGITEERLALFRTVKASCKEQGIEQPTVAQLQAAVAINPQNERVGVRL